MCAAGRGSRPSRHTQGGCGCQKGFAPLLKARGLCSALLWWRFRRVFLQFSSPGQAHPCGLPIPPALVPVAVPTRGCAWEAALLLLLLPHCELLQNPVGCAAVPPLTQLTCMEWGSSCLCSPAQHCYPLTSVIFPNLYICFYKFSRKLRSNLFPPVIPLHPPSALFFFFFSRHILHYVKHRWRNIFSKSALPLCLQQLGLDLAAYLIKGGSCTFYSFL